MSADNVVKLRRRILWNITNVLVTFTVVLFFGLVVLLSPPKPNQNALAIGKQAKQGQQAQQMAIILQSPIELDYKSRREVMQLRRQAVNKYPDLLAASYEPSQAVFGNLEDGRPWWGMAGQFYYGQGEKSIAGPAEESRFLMNPYLLVAADFFGITLLSTPGWNQAMIKESYLTQPDFPLICQPRALYWYPVQARAEAIYNITECLTKMSYWATGPLTLKYMFFDLIAYNARDLNLNYLYVSFKDSANLDQYNRNSSVFAISHFLVRGDSCQYPGGCNNMGPDTPEISHYTVTELPARIHIRLWKDKPSSAEQPADMVFIIHFE